MSHELQQVEQVLPSLTSLGWEGLMAHCLLTAPSEGGHLLQGWETRIANSMHLSNCF